MKFSIATASFNQLPFLELCINSVADQVHSSNGSFKIEHIIHDGGSDGIDSFVSKMQNRHPNSERYTLKFFIERDTGMYDALNRAFRKAEGEVVAWLNSDEQYLPGTLAFVQEFFSENTTTEILLGDVILTNTLFQPVCYRRIMLPNKLHTKLIHFHAFSCAMFFRGLRHRLVFEERWRVIGDAVLFDKLTDEGCVISCSKTPLSTFALTGENLSGGRARIHEMALWRKREGYQKLTWLAPFVSANHRLRRLIYGAYNRFKLDTQFYSLSSPDRRIPFKGSLNGRWPSS